MRNINAMNLRSRTRRRKREAALPAPQVASEKPDADPHALIGHLPRALAIVALLALSGHTRAEIRHLLRISDDALRQRVATLRKSLTGRSPAPSNEWSSGLSGNLAFGSIRKSLLPLTRKADILLASHDPDGHVLAIKIRRPPHKPAIGGNRSLEHIHNP